KIGPGGVAAWRSEAGDEPKLNRVFWACEHDRNGRGCRLGCDSWSGAAGRDDDRDPLANQIGCKLWKPVELVLGPTVFDRDVLPLDIACLLQALAKGVHPHRKAVTLLASQIAPAASQQSTP